MYLEQGIFLNCWDYNLNEPQIGQQSSAMALRKQTLVRSLNGVEDLRKTQQYGMNVAHFKDHGKGSTIMGGLSNLDKALKKTMC